MTDFRKKAEECLRAAEKMRDRAERIAMIRTACDYMDVADEAANIDCADKEDQLAVTNGLRPSQDLPPGFRGHLPK
jgi:hypothetical protein